MALPTRAQLLANGFFKDGLPFVNIEAKSLDTKNSTIFLDGMPFYGLWDGEVAPPVEPPAVVYNAAQFFIMF